MVYRYSEIKLLTQNMKNIKFYFIFILLVGLGLGFGGAFYFFNSAPGAVAEDLKLDDQEATIRAIKKVIPAVVSIMVYDPDEKNGTGENGEKLKGQGSGFIISKDGLILTNKHVAQLADNKTGEYKVILNNGKNYYAQFIGIDPLNDLAILKIFDKNLPYVDLGDSGKLQLGTSVIAIGNSLGRYQNSVTKGIISGLERELLASDNAGNTEYLYNVIQTDAEINSGNSGGPLVDLSGKVVGINVAMDEDGSAIGFALPINDAKQVIKSVLANGYIVRPRLGVNYAMLDEQIAQENKLQRNYGAWVIGDEKNSAVMPGSPADKAELKEGDIIFEVNAIKVDGKNPLQTIIQRYKVGDRIGLRIQRGDKIIVKIVTLDRFK